MSTNHSSTESIWLHELCRISGEILDALGRIADVLTVMDSRDTRGSPLELSTRSSCV